MSDPITILTEKRSKLQNEINELRSMYSSSTLVREDQQLKLWNAMECLIKSQKTIITNKSGYWIFKQSSNPICSVCKMALNSFDEHIHFCPNCGSKMSEGDE